MCPRGMTHSNDALTLLIMAHIQEICPLPDFQGAKFNYVIDSVPGRDWAYMRFRFRAVLENKWHPEWNSKV